MYFTEGHGEKVKMDEYDSDKDEVMWVRDGHRIVNVKERDHVLDIKEQNDEDGAKVIVWDYLEQDNQH